MLGFIGCGNMAQAMMKGIIAKGIFAPDQIIASRRNEKALLEVQSELGIQTTTDNREVAEKADIIILAVKPFQFADVIDQIKDLVTTDKLVISIAAGQTIANIEALFGKEVRLVRTMPNTPALVMEGATGMCFNKQIREEDKKTAVELFESFGVVAVVAESMIDIVIGVSGSSPAYVFMFIEAMADGGVRLGLPRDVAYRLASQTLIGAGMMQKETQLHPGILKDQVCSPGGITIKGVETLEENGFRNAVLKAIKESN